MAARSDVPTVYQPTPPGTLPGSDPIYLKNQLQAISDSIASCANLVPQVAAAAPKLLSDGMIRLARSPWHPASGQSTDAWVYYNLPTKTWLLVT
jgi:hypothetical protein